MPRYLHAIFLAFLLILTASTASAYAPQGLSMSEQKADNQTDPAGNIVWRENYRPFGEKVNNQAASADNRQWFHGKAADADTGLQYFGARYYDPVLGRFMGVDPVGFQEDNIHSFNKYAYGNKNPYRFIDPDGRNAVTFVGGVLTEGYNWAKGGKFDAAMVGGALIDGYNGQGAGFWSAAGQDALQFGGGALIGAIAKGLRVVSSGAGSTAVQAELILYRRGASDTKALLTRDAAAAEANIGIHGVSTSTSSAAKAGQSVRCASCTALEEAGFKVTQTGKDLKHHTVELPKPVTSEVVRRFNAVFE